MLISNITNSHKDALNKLLIECDSNFTIVSPFLASQMLAFLDEFDFSKLTSIELITTFKRNDPEQLTKPFQLRDFFDYFKTNYPDVKTSIHINNNLHGKLYISGKNHKEMILTSGNFTKNGMVENHEWGILIEENAIVQEVLEELFDNIDYSEISYNQLKKACMFAEKYSADNPKWGEKVSVSCDILDAVYSDSDLNNSDPQYFLKPIGHSDNPIFLEDQRDFSGLHQNLHFSKKMPKGVRKGDIVITTAVGAGSLLSFFRVTGGVQHVTDEQIGKEPWMERWPWYMEGRNNSPKFGREWWMHDLRRQDLLEEFRILYPDTPVTQAGGFTLGTLNMGNDKVRITKEFGEFLIRKIQEHENSEKELLEISLDPADPEVFKQELLEAKKALITTYYNDGSRETKPWNALRFTEDSGVFGNLRTREEFRQGEWQKRNIKRVHVTIKKQ